MGAYDGTLPPPTSENGDISECPAMSGSICHAAHGNDG
jgi:hypothetical protein